MWFHSEIKGTSNAPWILTLANDWQELYMRSYHSALLFWKDKNDMHDQIFKWLTIQCTLNKQNPQNNQQNVSKKTYILPNGTRHWFSA